MTPEERSLLNTIAQTVEENNKILHSMRRTIRWNTALNWLYWILIIGSAVGAFWLIQPYIDTITKSYAGFQGEIGQFKNYLNTSQSK